MHSPRRESIPTRLGKYEVRAKIGEGGMAAVYLGHFAGGSAISPDPAGGQPSTSSPERVVALKVIKDEFSLNHDFVNMFLDEAKIVSRLSHPNIVQVFELGCEGTRLFIAMELLFGQSFWHVWNACRERSVRLRYDVIAWLGARAAEGLHHAHDLVDAKGVAQNLVHRDINASNIFVTYDGQVKIIDFGLAKAANRVSKTAAGVVKGKLAYMAPEQAIGKPLDRRCDVFALAISLWEISVDRRLFKGKDDIDTLKRVYAAEVPDPTALVEGYPPQLWAVLKRALSREVSDRHASAAELSRELDACARMEGRVVNAATVAEVMRELFADEKNRHASWIADASSPNRPAPKDELMRAPASLPPPAPQGATAPEAKRLLERTALMWPGGAPPAGVFAAPPKTQPVPVMADLQAASNKTPPPPETTTNPPSSMTPTAPSSASVKGAAIAAAVATLLALGLAVLAILWLARR